MVGTGVYSVIGACTDTCRSSVSTFIGTCMSKLEEDIVSSYWQKNSYVCFAIPICETCLPESKQLKQHMVHCRRTIKVQRAHPF